MNISKVSIFIDNEWLDISKNIETKQGINIQTRCDEAFATGSFVAWLDISLNIPPYTPLKIDNEMYLCCSSCKRHLINSDVYIHTFEILELTAYMACWILGSKNFSSQTTWPEDWRKMHKIYALMAQKYGLTYSRSGWDNKFTQNQEFTFGPGTTMYDAYTEIMGTYNCKPKIKSFDPTKNEFVLSYVDLSASSEYVIDEAKVLDTECFQNTDNYSNFLESEVSNVVDRNNTTLVTNLSTRWDTVQMSADSNKLVLPTRIEEIVKLSVAFQGTLYLSFKNINIEHYFWRYINSETGELDIQLGTYKTLYQWCLDTIPLGNDDITLSPLYKLILKASEDNPNIINTGKFLNNKFYLEKVPADGDSYIRVAGYTSCSLDLTDRILEEQQYNCLEAKDKPRYCYYKSGDYYIDGLNERYKDDFWNIILGNSENTMLGQIIEEKTEATLSYSLNGVDTLASLDVTFFSGMSENAVDALFDVEYYPIVDMLISKEKSVKPANELLYKPISRSYTNGANFIDFDRLENSVQKTNDFLGLEEFTIEYDITNSAPPTSGQYISYVGVKWYISSVSRTITLKKDIAVINLVRDYNKVADAIGVKTQFNSTKMPLNNIIDRHVFDVNDEFVWFYPDMYVALKANNSWLYKRVAVLTAKKGVYITFEALDNYAFDRKAEKIEGESLLSSYAKITDIPYGDSNNEQASYTYFIGKLSDLTLNESFSLPIISDLGDRSIPLTFNTKTLLVYKDARERLLFTIYFPNAIYFKDSDGTAMYFTVNAGSQIDTFKVTRISTEVEGLNTGILMSGLGSTTITKTVYTSDVLRIEATALDGFYVEDYVTQIKAGYTPININLVAKPYVEPILPTFDETTRVVNSGKRTNTLTYYVVNNNSIRVKARIRVSKLTTTNGYESYLDVIDTTEYILPGKRASGTYIDTWTDPYYIRVTFSSPAFKDRDISVEYKVGIATEAI